MASTRLKLKFICSSELARNYEHQGKRQWVPLSVCTGQSPSDKSGDLLDIAIEDWWLAENPWDKGESKGQQDLFS